MVCAQKGECFDWRGEHKHEDISPMMPSAGHWL